MESDRDKHLEFLLGSQCGSCQVTTDRSEVKYSTAVVLFNHPDLAKNFDVPDPSTRLILVKTRSTFKTRVNSIINNKEMQSV